MPRCFAANAAGLTRYGTLPSRSGPETRRFFAICVPRRPVFTSHLALTLMFVKQSLPARFLPGTAPGPFSQGSRAYSQITKSAGAGDPPGRAFFFTPLLSLKRIFLSAWIPGDRRNVVPLDPQGGIFPLTKSTLSPPRMRLFPLSCQAGIGGRLCSPQQCSSWFFPSFLPPG